MKNLLLLLVLHLLFSCGDSLDKELTSKMLEDGYTGQGTYTNAKGDKYVGEWKDDMPYGQGTYTYASGDKYVGERKDNMMNGQGIFTYADGKIEKGLWKNDEFVGE
jgi:hypothetical protein